MPRFVLYLLAGLAAVGLAVGIGVYSNRGAHLQIKGAILKTRVLATSEASAVVICDIRVENVSEVRFVSRAAHVVLTSESGETLTGDSVAEMDLDRLFEYFKAIGPKYNPVLRPRQTLHSRQQSDWTVAASFAIPESAVARRQALKIVLEDVDGAKLELR